MSRAQSPVRESSGGTDDVLRAILDRLERVEMRQANALKPVKAESISSKWPFFAKASTSKAVAEETVPIEAEVSEDEGGDTSSPFNLRDVLPLISSFNGNNVENFIRQIERQRTRLPHRLQPLLLEAVIAQKLTGRAENCIRIDCIEIFEDLYKRLRFLFGERESLESLIRKRDACVQGPTESMENFVARFMKIQDTIRGALDNLNLSPTEHQYRERLESENAVRAFIRSVNERIEIRISAKNPYTLSEAISAALEIDTDLRTRRVIFGQKPTESRKQDVRRNPVPKPWNSKFCNYCKKPGHLEEQCHLKRRNFPSMGHPREPPRVHVSHENENQMQDWQGSPQQEVEDPYYG